ncbi:unnamed protein product [Trichobilharzia regenti]|nr:unnamed protein product [Trichobilharzia regenti]
MVGGGATNSALLRHRSVKPCVPLGNQGIKNKKACTTLFTLNLLIRNYLLSSFHRNETPDNMSEMNSYNDDIDDEGDEDVRTESFTTHSTTMAGTTIYPSMNRVTSTYCSGSQVGGGGIMTSTTGTKTTALPTSATTAAMTLSIKGLNTPEDIPLKAKASNCDIISSYLEMAIRSCIEEHLFHERLPEWKVYNTTEKLDTINYPVGFNHTLKQSCDDIITSQKINLTVSFYCEYLIALVSVIFSIDLNV